MNFCVVCGSKININDSFCGHCGSKIENQKSLNEKDNAKLVKKIKILSIISIIIEIISVIFFASPIAIMFGLETGEANGLMLLFLPFLLIYSVVFLIFMFLNIKYYKASDISNIKKISIAEIILSVFGLPFGILLLIVSIIKLYFSSKN